MILKSIRIIGIGIVFLLILLLGYREIKKGVLRTKSEQLIKEGGISEHREITINGSKQHIVIEGRKKDSPILLFLHGGPGMPVPFGASSRAIYPKITKAVTAVYWDQCGAGKSFKGARKEDLTIEQMVADTVALTNYLRKEFGQEKIYILGISWGTVLGLLAVAKKPELYHSYFSYAQLTNLPEATQIVYDWLMGNLLDKDMEPLEVSKEDREILRGMGSPPFSKEEEAKFSEISNRVLGKNEVLVKEIAFLKPMLFSPDYSLSSIYNSVLKAGKLNIIESNLIAELKKLNFKDEIKELKIPVTFLNGRYDKVVPLCQIRSFMDGLQAPEKELVIVEHSAHMPSSEDMENMTGVVVRKILEEQEGVTLF
ncbi:alpha/beta fold hydrolase [Candidatus Enterococcus huntleyi]|uniref:alpha/beta fold hydrolase n=1 Tax=Candidatus Enterococcus huntleyi TaxID=1857217 RepID=UPI001F310418|nr:alpha/beta hydrolase [Enterococcus sp. JM4C]